MIKLLVVLISMPFFAIAQSKTGINFEYTLNWTEIRAKAKAENKFIFVDCYTTWCGPCKQMDRKTFVSDTVGSFMNDKFISVKVQMDSTDKDNERIKNWYNDARMLQNLYKIEGYPTCWFIQPDGHMIYRSEGFKTVSEFLEIARIAIDAQSQINFSALEEFKKNATFCSII